MDVWSRNRTPLGGLEVVVCLLVALECLAVNALAVTHLPELTLDSVRAGPLALAFHDKHPQPLAVAVILILLLLGAQLPRFGRAAVFVFVGAAVANFVSPLIWRGGVPDYIVLQRIDVIMNVPDVLMIASAMVVVASMLGASWRRRANP
jgi:hypothetical protein